MSIKLLIITALILTVSIAEAKFKVTKLTIYLRSVGRDLFSKKLTYDYSFRNDFIINLRTNFSLTSYLGALVFFVFEIFYQVV